MSIMRIIGKITEIYTGVVQLYTLHIAHCRNAVIYQITTMHGTTRYRLQQNAQPNFKTIIT